MRIRAAALAGSLALAVLLAGCGGSSSSSPSSSGATASQSSGSEQSNGSQPTGEISSGASSDPSASDPSSSEPAAATPGPEVPPATEVAPAVAEGLMPTSTGSFGDKPTFTFPSTLPPNSLQRKVLTEGTGKTVQSGDWLSADYEGIVWGADKPFDNSYDRKKPSFFQIGTGAVVSGWDTTLVGLKVGTRVLISLPPADGYKSAGNPQAGIKGTDTIVFVIDIVDTYAKDAGGQADAKAVSPLPTGIPTVTGALGKQPKITVPSGLAQPNAARAVALSVGTGEKLASGDTMLAQFELTTWDGSQTQGTWPAGDDPQREGLQSIPLQTDSPFEKLAGLTVGSRVLLLVPPSDASSSGSASPAIAAVVDIVAKS